MCGNGARSNTVRVGVDVRRNHGIRKKDMV